MPQHRTDIHDLPTHFRTHWRIPAIAVAVTATVAVGFALLRPAEWEATQTLWVRDEAASNSVSRPGRFEDQESMKMAQETIMELARSRSVVAAAMSELGPPAGQANGLTWPSLTEIEKVQGSLRITPPNGAEFGRTEVFHVSVTQPTPERAVGLAVAIEKHLNRRLQELRDARATSLVTELTETVQLARNELNEATRQLIEIEQGVGGDLGELRILNEAAAGESNLRQSLIAIQGELREARGDADANAQLLELLKAARLDPNQLVANTQGLLSSQPAIRQLKDGLVRAKLASAGLMGEMSVKHPRVIAAMATENQIRRHLHDELATAIQGLQVEGKIHQSRIEQLAGQESEIVDRMQRLANVRAPYGNLLSAVQHRSGIVERAESELAEARASLAAAHTATLITSLDKPQTGNDPAGLRKSFIVVIGIAGGFVIGLGMVLLIPNHANRRIPASAPTSMVSRPSEAPLSGLSLIQALQRIGPSRN